MTINQMIILTITILLVVSVIGYGLWHSQIQEDKDELILQNSVLFKGTGFDDLPTDSFTIMDLEELQAREKSLQQMFDDESVSFDKKDAIRKELLEIPDRLQNPFQTGVPYELMKILREKVTQITQILHVLIEDEWLPITNVGGISSSDQAVIIGIDEKSFTMSNLKKYDQKIRQYLGDEINIIYKKSNPFTLEE